MNQLFIFIARQRGFILFVFLEVLSLWCYFKFNNYPSAVYFNTANSYVAGSLAIRRGITQYLTLGTVNDDLARQNAQLLAEITRLRNARIVGVPTYKADSLMASRFEPIVARVIKNEVAVATNNYITIDKGTSEGITPGMGVVSPTGVVGIVKACNEHFSVVTTVLHLDPPMQVSSRVKRSNEIGTSRWEGNNTEVVKMLYISRYRSVKMADTVVTSDQNSVFPPGISVGTVKKLGISADQTFWDIDLRLATDFRNLSYVYVVKNHLNTAQKQVEDTLLPVKK